jgi:hypothetical protein
MKRYRYRSAVTGKFISYVKWCATDPGTTVAEEITNSGEVMKLKKRIESLEGIAAQAYQLAGIVGAPIKVLDLLSDAAAGKEIGDRNFLPIDEIDLDIGKEVERLRGIVLMLKETLFKIAVEGWQLDLAVKALKRAKILNEGKP